MIILITNKEDVSADFVVQELHERHVKFWRFNTEDAPTYQFVFDPNHAITVIQPDGNTLTMDESITGVWYRRPAWVGPYTDETGEFINDQWRQFIWGLTAFTQGKWINDPFLNQRAECKPIQLRFAVEEGLAVPLTQITNSSLRLHQFRHEIGNGTIIKAIFSPLLEDSNQFVFTHLLQEVEMPQPDEAELCPFICQEALLPKRDIRVTIVGNQIFAAELIALEYENIDWRRRPTEGKWVHTELPPHITNALIRFCRRLGLVFAAIDLVFCRDKYFFLEVNPNGEWGWLQTSAGLPIASALADYLTRIPNKWENSVGQNSRG